ncbi:hypothetical protein LTR66_003802 [Elasticomyces elasticus]|nr:hypothetical protein LTR66_003802 [Elasticomyces elasticus]
MASTLQELGTTIIAVIIQALSGITAAASIQTNSTGSNSVNARNSVARLAEVAKALASDVPL